MPTVSVLVEVTDGSKERTYRVIENLKTLLDPLDKQRDACATCIGNRILDSLREPNFEDAEQRRTDRRR
jgi:hypothetical protein